MSAFTPAPWSAADEPDPIGKRYVIHSVPTATGVAHCWTKPDARLIAAAPAIHDALNELLDAVADRHVKINADPLRKIAVQAAILAARTALAQVSR